MKRKIIIAVVTVISLLVVYYFYNVWQQISKMSNRGGNKTVDVTVVKAAQQEWYDQIATTGSINAIQGVTISSEVSGRVTEIYFEDGIAAKKGDPLYQIYPDILEAQLANAEAAASLALIDYNRSKELYKKNAVSEADLDTKSSQLAQKNAIVSEYQAQLRQYNIVAPFAGQLGLHLVDVGSFVTNGQSLVNLQQLDPVRIDFSVPENQLSELTLEQTVEVKASSDPSKVYTGTIYAFDSVIDVDTRSLSVRAKVANPEHRLLPGTFAEINILAGKKHPVVTLPQTAIVYNLDGNYVFKADNNIAKKVNVTLGDRRGNDVEITSGVLSGDSIIATGQLKLFDNSPINILPESGEQ